MNKSSIEIDFQKEKKKLLEELNSEINKHSENETLKALKNILLSYNTEKDLNKSLTRIIIDSFQLNLSVNEKLINFENYFSDYSNSLKSEELRKLAKYLIKLKKEISFFGVSWSNNESRWIYFETILDLRKIKEDFSFSENIIEYENLDPKSGLERGFIDKITGEGIMGNIK